MFAFNPTREKIWANLGAVLAEMQVAQLSGVLFLDGSYVTDKEHPGDIEVTLDVRSEPLHVQGLAVMFYLQHHQRIKADLGVDWYPTLPAENDFVVFFQYLGDKTAALKKLKPKDLKGILKVTTWTN